MVSAIPAMKARSFFTELKRFAFTASQSIELITLALIHKFMDDLDGESVKLGGKRSFFVGPLEKYRWRAQLGCGLSVTQLGCGLFVIG
jgi:hypothetical protein